MERDERWIFKNVGRSIKAEVNSGPMLDYIQEQVKILSEKLVNQEELMVLHQCPRNVLERLKFEIESELMQRDLKK